MPPQHIQHLFLHFRGESVVRIEMVRFGLGLHRFCLTRSRIGGPPSIDFAQDGFKSGQFLCVLFRIGRGGFGHLGAQIRHARLTQLAIIPV